MRLIIFLLLPFLLLESACLQAQQVKTKHDAAKVFSPRFHLTEAKSYRFQRAYVDNATSKGKVIQGYKAGITSEAAQQRFAIEKPITGVLLKTPKLADQTPVFKLAQSYQLFIELELAFQLKQDINEKLSSVDELKPAILAVAAAVELPDMSFPESNFNGFDIIANNALAYEAVIGPWHKDLSQINQQQVALYCGDEKLHEGVSSNALGDQWQALLWMVNHLQEQGFSLKAGQILLTGNLIELTQAKPCQYRGEFGDYGTINFGVEP